MKPLLALGVLTVPMVALGQARSHVVPLSECIAIAVKQSPQIRAYNAELNAALISAESDRPVARPVVNLIASGGIQGPGSKLDVPGMTENVTVPQTSGRVGIRLDQPLYRAGLGAARSRYIAIREAATANWNEEISAFDLSVAEAYNNVIKAQWGMVRATRGLAEAQQFHQVVAQQIAAGFGKPVDIGDADTAVAEAQAGVQRAKDGLLLARYNLNNLMGRPFNTAITCEIPASLVTTFGSTDECIQSALKVRPELVILRARLKEATAGRALATAQSMPQLSLRAEADEQTPTALQREHYAAVMLHFKWPLLDGGQSRRDTEAAQQQIVRLQSLLTTAVNGITLDVLHRKQQLDEAKGNLRAAIVARDSAEAQERVAMVSYEVGKGSAMDLQKALHTLWVSRDAVDTAKVSIFDAVANLQHSMGQDLPAKEVAE